MCKDSSNGKLELHSTVQHFGRYARDADLQGLCAITVFNVLQVMGIVIVDELQLSELCTARRNLVC